MTAKTSRPLVVGFDSGYGSAGYAQVELGNPLLIVSLGVIRTKSSSKKLNVLGSNEYSRRVREIACVVLPLVSSEVVAICIESPSFPRNSATCFKLGCFYGMVYTLCEQNNIPISNVSPQELKKAVTGQPTASKDEVGRALSRRFGTDIEQRLLRSGIPKGQHEHAFDALGAVVASLDSELLRLAMRMGG